MIKFNIVLLIIVIFMLGVTVTDMTMELKFQKKQPTQEQKINPCQQ